MKKLFTLILSLCSILSMAQTTDATLTVQAQQIKNETVAGANTATRVGTHLQNLVYSKKSFFVDGTASGTNTYSTTLDNGAIVSLASQWFVIKFTNGNSGASTLNINATGALSLVKADGSALSSGDITSGSIHILAHNGSALQVLTLEGSGGGSGVNLGNSDLTLTGERILSGGNSFGITFEDLTYFNVNAPAIELNLSTSLDVNSADVNLTASDDINLAPTDDLLLNGTSGTTGQVIGNSNGHAAWGNIIAGHVIEDEGTPLTQRSNMNFAGAGVAVTDAGGKTVVTIAGGGSGTVTSVAALTLGTTGTDLSSSVANGTTTPVITLNVPTASASNRGALSSTDWSTFNGKQTSDADLTTIAGLSPSNDDFLQFKSSAWTNRTLAQVRTDLALVSASITDGVTASAPDQNQVFDALALKQNLINSATTLTDASTIDLTAIKHTLATSSATRTFTISYTGDDITIIVTLSATTATYTFPATALCVSDGFPSGDNTMVLSGTSGDKYAICVKKVGSDYYVVSKNFGQ